MFPSHDHAAEGIKSGIDSLVSQNYDNYEIHFNIPQVNKFSGKNYVVPQWLLEPKYHNVKIYRIKKDLGPVTKLFPTVARLDKNEDIIIVVVDDDLVYHPDMIMEQVRNQEKWPHSCVGYDGLRSRDLMGRMSNHFKDVRDYYYTSNRRNSIVDILQHYKSVSYKREYFEDDFFDFVNDHLTWNDDLLLAAYFSFKKRDRIVTYHDTDVFFSTRS